MVPHSWHFRSNSEAPSRTQHDQCASYLSVSDLVVDNQAAFREFDPLYQKLYAADKCCGLVVPELNPDLPRTSDEIS